MSIDDRLVKYSKDRNDSIPYVYEFLFFFPQVHCLFQTARLLNLGQDINNLKKWQSFDIVFAIMYYTFIAKSSCPYVYSRPYYYWFLRIFPPVHLFKTLSLFKTLEYVLLKAPSILLEWG